MTQQRGRYGGGYIRKRGNSFSCQFRHDGATLHESFKFDPKKPRDEQRAKRDAHAWLARMQSDAVLGVLGVKKPEPERERPTITFRLLTAALIYARTEAVGSREKPWTPGTVKWFRGHVNSTLNLAFGDRLVHEITPTEISAFLNEQARRPILHQGGPLKGQPTGRTVSAASLKHYERALSLIFAFAVAGPEPGSDWLERFGLVAPSAGQGWIATSPMAIEQGVKRTHAPPTMPKRAFRARELVAILDAARAREDAAAAALAAAGPDDRRRLLELQAYDAKRDRVLFTTLALTGMRLGEVARMRWHWVNFEDELLWVKEAKKGRDLLSQEIPLSPRLRDTLKEWGPRAPEQLVFPSWPRAKGPRSQRLPEDEKVLTTIDKPIRRALELAKVEGPASAHTFRHTFSSLLARCGVLPHVYQQLMRHAARSMTERYTHAEVDCQREALALLERAIYDAPRLITLPKTGTAG